MHETVEKKKNKKFDFPVEITEQILFIIRISSWRNGTHSSKAREDIEVPEGVMSTDFIPH